MHIDAMYDLSETPSLHIIYVELWDLHINLKTTSNQFIDEQNIEIWPHIKQKHALNI